MILHAVGRALDDDGFSLVEEAVQNGGGDAGIVTENRRPLLERLVGGDDEGAALVALADDLEEEVGPGLVQRQVGPAALQNSLPIDSNVSDRTQR